MTTSNRRIAKNTLLLYFRMFITMFVSLYISREVLRILGIEDFGIYNIIGGIIVLFSFINGALVSSTQRFLNYEIGSGDVQRQRSIFNSTVTIYIIFCILIVVVAETAGLWFLNNKLNIPHERLEAANWVYQASLVTFCLNILRVPYNAVVIAHERMSFYAYLSIAEVVMKLIILFPLTMVHIDKLVLYAVLVAVISFFVFVFYRIYCKRQFAICNYRFAFDKQEYRELLGFSMWNLFGSGANMLVSQGINILFNLFYGVTLNASIGLTNQVKNAVSSFLINFQTAFSPQIVKSYAGGEKERFQQLILFTSKYSYFLTILVILPFLFNADFIISKWLTVVPIYLVPFTKWSLLSLVIDSLSAPLGIAVQATGTIRKYQILYSVFSFSVLPVAVLITFLGKHPIAVFIVWTAGNLGIYIWKIWFVSKLIKMPIRLYCSKVIGRILLVSILGGIAVFLFHSLSFFRAVDWSKFVASTSSIILALLTLIYLFGLDELEKNVVKVYLKQRLNIR